MGGHFERLVRTIKASLATAISRKLLTLEEFVTVVKEAENIVNSRPLTYQSDETRDVPLSPSQLAWGRDLTLMPPLLQPGDPLDEDYDARATRAQYVLLSNALERFQKRWHNEYLLSLREKHYNRCAENPTHHLSVGKLVMVRHDKVHRTEWPLGVITAIYPGERGVIRTAEVEECGRRSLRPVSYLVPLELDCHHDDDELRQCLQDKRRNEEDDDNDDNEDAAAVTTDVGSFLRGWGPRRSKCVSRCSGRGTSSRRVICRANIPLSYVGQLPSERPGHRHHNWVQLQQQQCYSHQHSTVSPTTHSLNPTTRG